MIDSPATMERAGTGDARSGVHWSELPCAIEDGDLWFAATSIDADRAKALCHTCPLQRSCLQGAIARQEPHGVWGGEVFYEGIVVARKRTRGRPRNGELRQRDLEREARANLRKNTSGAVA